MKTCPECARSYSDEAVVCAFDGTPLSSGSTAAWEAIKSAEPQEGDVLGQYRIVEQIGRGGMGVIFKAEHVRLGRQVALKVLRSTLIKRTDAVQRFFSEAKAVNEIGHPNIVDIIDFVELVDADPPLVYMVMELLQGENLGEHLRRTGPLTAAATRLIALQITDALSATHKKSILHRDLKPENVFLVATKDGSLKVKLLDFGVAKGFGRRKAQDLTNPGLAVGTPSYMAPEQILERPLDDRTDIYTLGLLLYEALTGEVPFNADNAGDILVKQVKVAPTPPSELQPSIPPTLEQVVMTCLEKDPDRRYANMTAVRRALEEMLGTMVDQPLPPPRRRPLWPLFFISVVLLLLSGALIWALGTVPPEPEKKTNQPLVQLAHPDASPSVQTPDIGVSDVERIPDAARAQLPTALPKKRRPRRRRRRPRKRGKTKLRPKAKTKTKKINREGTVDPFSLSK